MLTRLEEAAMASDGDGDGAGHLADNLESRGAGTGGLVGGCTVVFSGRRGDRDRNEWVGAAKTAIRVVFWGGLVWVAGGSLTTG